jgi:Fe-S cluster assembly protein SufD
MKETPQVIVRGRKPQSENIAEFKFTEDLVRLIPNSSALTALRQAAWKLATTLPMPSPKDEAWRRTDLKGLQSESFVLPKVKQHLDLAAVPADLLRPLTAESHGGQVILQPGGAQVEINEMLLQKGVVFTDLLTAEKEHPDLLEKIMGKVVKASEGKFAALATAISQNGVFLYVPRNVQIEQPLHSLLWGPGSNLAFFSHILVYLESGASVTYVHEAASPTETQQAMHVGVIEIFVGPEASLKFVELQSWGEHVWNFSHERAQVDRGGQIDWIFGAIGSHLTKNFSDLELTGEGSAGRMSGFYFTDHDQHLDHDTQQNHLAPHTTSDLLFKGALLDQSRSVWQGMIYVAPGAQKTDGYQANRNLVLSRNARADSIPGLEILADDVRCTHGATVGQIDEDQVFYLMARGIPRVTAERLVVEGFFDPIMQRIPFEGVRERFQSAIHQKMMNYTGK